jgi:hypothetical protein
MGAPIVLEDKSLEILARQQAALYNELVEDVSAHCELGSFGEDAAMLTASGIGRTPVRIFE